MAINGALHGLDLAKAQRLKEIQDKWAQFPGRAVNGTGLTGLVPNDAQGYSDMLNEQTEALDLENEAEGKPPVRVTVGATLPSQGHGIADDPTSSFSTATGPYGAFGSGPSTEGPYGSLNPSQRLAGLSGQVKPPMPETHEAFMARMTKKFGAL